MAAAAVLSRRNFLRGMAGACVAGSFGFSAEAFLLAPRRVVVEEITISIKDLPPAFEGFTICQVTDTHHGPYVGLSYIEEVVDKANKSKPDLVVLTGDYVSEDRKFIKPVIRVLGRLRGKYGIFAVLGNHDHWVDEGAVSSALNSERVPVLRNSHAYIEKDGSRFCLAGVGDLHEDTPDAIVALKGVSNRVPRIVLSHNPDYAESLPPGERVDLMLSGHTHGGQVIVPFTNHAPIVPSKYGQKYSSGLVRRGKTQIYTSRGIGVSILPIRFNCPPEIALLRLKRAKDGS